MTSLPTETHQVISQWVLLTLIPLPERSTHLGRRTSRTMMQQCDLSPSCQFPSLSHCVGLLFSGSHIFFFLFPPLFRAIPAAYVSSQARGWIGATAASLHHSHSNSESEPRLRPIPQLTARPDLYPLSGPGIESASPWMLVRFVSAEPRQELLSFLFLFLIFIFKSFTEVQLINNVVIISVVQQNDSVIHTHVHSLSDSFPL